MQRNHIIPERTIERYIKALIDTGNIILRIPGRKGGYLFIDEE